LVFGLKIGIVGSNGFIGKNLCAYFKSAGTDFIDLGRVKIANELDTKRDSSIGLVDSIIWTASTVNPKNAEIASDLVKIEITNWKLFLDYVKALQNLESKEIRIVFLSSGGCVYDAGIPPYFVGDSTCGINEYGKMKVAMERLLIDSQMPYTILRIANAYGPDQPFGRGQGVMAEWNNSLRNQQSLKVFGSTNKIRDYIHIDDVVKAINLAANLQNSAILNVGSGEGVRLEQVMYFYKKHFGKNIDFQFTPDRKIDRQGYWLDIHKTQEMLKWNPCIELESGIKKMLENLQNGN
jgi:UDP-glucose 4-epimerase